MNDCLFCNIIAGEIPSEKIYEDEKTFAFLDINPVNPGHTLVLPKTHAINIFDITAEDWGAVMETVRTLATPIREAVGADGINIHVNNEEAAGQKVFHSHIHIIPRLTDDGLKHWEHTPYKDGEIDVVREKITAAL